jgi:hypothetical protein
MRVSGNKVKEILEIAGIEPVVSQNLTRNIPQIKTGGSVKLADIGAVTRNKEYIEQIRREVGRYTATLRSAQQKNVNKFYNKRTGQFQPFPPQSITDSLGNKDIFINAAKELAILVSNGVLNLETVLNVQPIDLDTGAFAQSDSEKLKQEISNTLGFPSNGVVRLSSRINDVNKFGATYTSVDIHAFAVFGNNTVVEVKGLTAVSWSRHKDKNSDRRSFESAPKGYTPGAKTYAGTLIFALFNEDPMRAISPLEFFHGNDPIAPSSGLTAYEEMDSTDMPGFDLCIVFTNEYGASSAMNIWGMTFTDDGGSVSTRQLENEVSFQYKAVKVDPIVPVKKGPEGEVNFFEPTFQGTALFEKKRRIALTNDYAGQNFEAMYKNTMDDIAKKFS